MRRHAKKTLPAHWRALPAGLVMTVLDEILTHKRREVRTRRRERDLNLAWRRLGAPTPRGFMQALRHRQAAGSPAVIAELKKASPSKGVIRADYRPQAIAKSYEQAGAACLSVLTDELYFQGADEHLQQARQAVSIPVLRKEFIVDSYQVLESVVLGADCILLIVSALTDAELHRLHREAGCYGLDVLVEVHDAADLERALAFRPRMVGINNRNLKTFETNVETTLGLLEQVPQDVLVVTESGFHEPRQVQAMLDRGVPAFLVGEAFMRAQDPGAALGELFGAALGAGTQDAMNS